MKRYVEEAGDTMLCNVTSLAGCEIGEMEYIDKWSARSPEEINEEIRKLNEKKVAKTKKRVNLLTRIATKTGATSGGKEEL
mmetsp:Transcript_7402/g.18842  ORF Transcript_7402/g.18842 Transcript_7402/m.18842 type:complete len:81 (+) Transcript_7402:486-728(+)